MRVSSGSSQRKVSDELNGAFVEYRHASNFFSSVEFNAIRLKAQLFHIKAVLLVDNPENSVILRRLVAGQPGDGRRTTPNVLQATSSSPYGLMLIQDRIRL